MIFLAPYIMAMLGRFDGNDTISRAVFLASSFLVACLSTFDIVISLAFLALAAGHRVPPTNALLPVITALPPGRRDRNIWQWMQDTSWWIADKTKYKGIDQFWTNYGLIYGVIRSLWMLPAILFMVGYAGNYWGFLALVNGVIYWSIFFPRSGFL